MKVGLNIDTQKVSLETGGPGGLTTTVSMTPTVARLVANQLIASAETIEIALEQGLIEDDA